MDRILSSLKTLISRQGISLSANLSDNFELDMISKHFRVFIKRLQDTQILEYVIIDNNLGMSCYLYTNLDCQGVLVEPETFIKIDNIRGSNVILYPEDKRFFRSNGWKFEGANDEAQIILSSELFCVDNMIQYICQELDNCNYTQSIFLVKGSNKDIATMRLNNVV